MPTLRALEDKIWKKAREGFRSQQDIVDYVRIVCLDAMHLSREGIISDSEAGRMMLKAIPEGLLARLTSRLEVKHPDHKPGYPYKLSELCEGLLWVGEGMAAMEQGQAAPVASVKTEVVVPAVKTEPTEMMAFAEALRGLTDVVQRLGQPQYGGGPPRGGYSSMGGAGRGGGPPMGPGGGYGSSGRPQACNFCNSIDHFIRNCPKVDEYVQSNRCVRGEGGRVVLPDGRYLPSWTRGRTMMERFDHFYAEKDRFNNPPAPPVVSQSLFEVSSEIMRYEIDSESSTAQQDEISAAEEQLKALEVMMAETRRKIDRRRGETEAIQVTTAKAGAGAKSGGGQKVVAAKGKDREPPVVAQRVVPRVESEEKTQGPQFKYHSAAEDTSLVKAVFDRALSGTVEVSQRELLALAPDLRRQMKEMTTTKRVPVVGAANVLLDEEAEVVEVANFSNVSQEHDAAMGTAQGVQDDEPIAVGEPSLPLQCLDVEINGQTVECVLDSGSQIVAMSEEKWEELRLHICKDKVMVMEAANRSKSLTLGVIENLKVKVGVVELILQVQVVPNAPYDVLLGRPFYALAECVTEDFGSGKQHLTMKDPATGHKFTVPTRKRVRKKSTPPMQGFQSLRSQ